MLKAAISFVAGGALELALLAERDRMAERAVWSMGSDSALGLVECRVTETAVFADDAPCLTHVLAVVTAEAALKVEVADIVRVRLPVGLHFGEGVGLEDALHLSRRAHAQVVSVHRRAEACGTRHNQPARAQRLSPASGR